MPQIILTTKWKFEYIIFRKNIDFRKMSIEYKTCSSNVHTPKRPYPGHAV